MEKSLEFTALKEIIEASFSRYVTVLSDCFVLPPKEKRDCIRVSLSTYHPARSLYRSKKLICRSLNGTESLKEKKACCDCKSRFQCTPQICLELIWEGIPLKLLLSYTSMRNFLVFNAKREKNNEVQIRVINRKTWGELVFSEVRNVREAKKTLSK